MLTLRTIAAATTLASCLLTVGCLADSTVVEETITESEQGFIYGNGIDPNVFWQSDVFGKVVWYSQNALKNGVGELPFSTLLNTNEGRDVLKHMIGCAMPKGTSIENAATGFVGNGSLGLASEWKSVPLDWVSGQRAVTACLLQSLNAYNIVVPVNMTGFIVPESDDDTSKFTFPDMIAFGNLFSATPKAYACTLKPLEAACGANTSQYAKKRICDTSPTCQLTLLGSCVEDGVCESDEKGNSKCWDPGGNGFVEAIMTSLIEDDAHALYPECSF